MQSDPLAQGLPIEPLAQAPTTSDGLPFVQRQPRSHAAMRRDRGWAPAHPSGAIDGHGSAREQYYGTALMHSPRAE